MLMTCPTCTGQFRPQIDAQLPGTCPHCHARLRPAGDTASSPPSKAVPELTRACRTCGERFSAKEKECPACGQLTRAAHEARERAVSGPTFGFEPENWMAGAGIWIGITVIGVAAVWFVGGLREGIVFFYPPCLAVVGVVAIVNGVVSRREQRRRRERREAKSAQGPRPSSKKPRV